MAPREKTFVGILEIGFSLFDNTAQRFKDFALGFDSITDSRLPGKAQIFEEGNARDFEIAPTERLRELASGLVNGNRRPTIE